MADPLSLAASVAGIVALADKVFVRTRRFLQDYDNNEKDIINLSQQVLLLSGALHSLSRMADALHSDLTDQDVASLRISHLAACHSTLDILERGLMEVDNATARRKKYAWPFASDRTKALLDEMSRHREIVDLALTSDSLGTLVKTLSGNNDTGPAEDVEDSHHRRDDFDVDDTMSIQSYADSIFDTASIGSSVSSVHSDTGALVGEYVEFLVRDQGLGKLFMRSMLPTVLGPQRFSRNYSRILQSYARDLNRQHISCSDGEKVLYTQALAFISRKSVAMKTASLIASRYMEKSPRTQTETQGSEVLNQQPEFENETSSGDESPVNESNQNFMISELGQYFREGAPFQRMKRNLRNLVIPITGLSRVKASTERMLDLVLRDDYLRFLLFKALSDPLVPLRDDPFDPETGIRYFGSSLKAEANSPDHVRLAEFIETYAGYIGTRAVQRMENMDTEEILQDSQVSASILY